MLHDVLEDCAGWTVERLAAEGFAAPILEALVAVTKREDEANDYPAFIQRAGANAIARRVKLADLEDNMDMSRITGPTARDLDRLVRYRDARALLLSVS